MPTEAPSPAPIQPREVKLPACPDCGRVSTQADGIYTQGLSYYCIGVGETRHRKKKMVPQLFREVVGA